MVTRVSVTLLNNLTNGKKKVRRTVMRTLTIDVAFPEIAVVSAPNALEKTELGCLFNLYDFRSVLFGSKLNMIV